MLERHLSSSLSSYVVLIRYRQGGPLAMQTNWLAATPQRQIPEADSSVRFQQTAVPMKRCSIAPQICRRLFSAADLSVTGAPRVRLCSTRVTCGGRSEVHVGRACLGF